jgi:hypothetical protein
MTAEGVVDPDQRRLHFNTLQNILTFLYLLTSNVHPLSHEKKRFDVTIERAA